MTDSQTPESRDTRKLVNEALPAYCDKQTVDIVVQLITTATLAAQKALLERFKQDAKETGNNLWDINEIAEILQRPATRKGERTMTKCNNCASTSVTMTSGNGCHNCNAGYMETVA